MDKTTVVTPSVGSVEGYAQIGSMRLDVHHGIALMLDDSGEPEDRRIMVYLSAQPLDAARASSEFNINVAVDEQQPEGGYIRVCLTAEGQGCGFLFLPGGINGGDHLPGGFGGRGGKFSLKNLGPNRIAGRYHQDRAEYLFGDRDEQYQFDVSFDLPVTPTRNMPLPPGGDAPGEAYRTYLSALAKEDMPALQLLSAREVRWRRLFEEDRDPVNQALRAAREDQPAKVEITGGIMNGGKAILFVTGVDGRDVHLSGSVLMRKEASGWVFVDSQLAPVEN